MATVSASSKNPFRSNASTPNVTGATVAQVNPTGPGQSTTSPPPTFSASVTAPPEAQAQITQPLSLADLDVEEPPPYTPRPANNGETIIEQGPRRPFQPAPAPRQPHLSPTAPGGSSFPSPSTPSGRGRPGGLLHQLTSSLNTMVDNLAANLSETSLGSRYPASGPQQGGWSGYPGQQTQPQAQYAPHAHPPPSSSLRVEPPPRHPASSLSSSSRAVSPAASASSEFAREFYAAGAGESGVQRSYTPPPGPPPVPPPRPALASPRSPAQTQTRHSAPAATSEFARDFYAAGASEPPSENQVPDDGRPTTTPVVGHPLLRDGKILVYPKRHECDKCHNVGYKACDPQRPCKKCWHKYAKPFTGPIVYSFSNTTPDSNFQRPLLSLLRPPAPPPRPAFSPSSSLPFSSPSQPHFARGGWMADPHSGGGGFYSPPTGVRPMGFGRPPPGAVVYTAGDPRIGGRLCWRCEGRGNTSFLILDRVTCEVCGGIGRVF